MNGTPGNGARHLSARVLQAQGMVSAQRGCGMDEALARLRIRARASGQDLEELALDVLDGIIRFDP
jgi:AmiR/NasT family two-component response regulator